MRVKLGAGVELDLLNKDELRGEMRDFMRDWLVEAARGPKHVLFSARGTIDANGGLYLGGTGRTLDSGRLGPEPSMVWSIKRVAVSGLSPNNDSVSLYLNNDSPNRLVKPGVTGYEKFGSDELVVPGGEALLFVGAGLVATGDVWVSGSAWELPVTMAYKLL